MFRTKLTLAFAAMLVFVLFLAGVLFWGASRSSYYLQRSQLAHYNLEAYLRLSNETYHHFKQLADVILIDEWRTRVDVSPSRRQLEMVLADIRTLTEAERDFVESDEVASEESELQRIDLIEQEIRDAQSEFQEVMALLDDDQPEEAWPRLSELLQNRIDGRFAELVGMAIAEEEGEVVEADREAQALLNLLTIVAWATVAASILFVALAGFVLIRRLRSPIETLVDGTHRLAEGALDHRITIPGNDEFSQLAGSFNIMAGRIERKRLDLLEARAGLERKVDERTKELNTANAALRQTDKERRRFLADVSHELRTPLTVIRGEAEVTLRGRAKPAAHYREALDRIVDQAAQLARLVDDLLLMARAQAGATRLKLTAIQLPDLLTKVCRDASVLLGDRRIEITPPDIEGDPMVPGDSGRLTQLFFILLDNAIRYSKPGGKISVEVGYSDTSAIVRVIDNGAGIPAADLPFLFERFYRSEQGRHLSPDGSGLGLPLAKGIVEAHGGQIGVESSPGVGTTVRILLPMAAKAQMSA